MARDKRAEGIDNTIMALREKIMEYFKGSCVERLTTNGNIHYTSVREVLPRPQHQYERNRVEEQNKRVYFLGEVPIFTVSHYPEQIVFHVRSLERSPELKEVYIGLKKLMSSYLSGVKVKENRGRITYADNV